MIEETLPTDWHWLDQFIGPLGDDFVGAVLERPTEQMRPALDDIFN
ncbi:hypothetical protein [Mesorhizobium sp. WSM3224]|nr:hypothetical protein [Mesorhizobium sp. WSM3224]